MHSLKDTVHNFLKHCQYERNFSWHTIKAYRLDLAHFLRFTTERQHGDALADVSRERLREYGHCLNCYKPRTQRRKMAALKSLFGFLEREGILKSNPAQSLRLDIRVGRPLPRTVGLPALELLFRHIYAKCNRGKRRPTPSKLAIRDVALLELLFSSGMRVSEISNLRVSALDLDRRSVLVRGKGNKERLIPICDAAVHSALAAYATLPRPLDDADPFFFTNRFGRRLSEQSIRMAVKRNGREVGLERITPHVFRHTVATMLLEQGVDLRFIQTFLGHSSIVTTTIYAHVTEKSQRDVLNQRHPRQLLVAATTASHSVASQATVLQSRRRPPCASPAVAGSAS